MRATLALGRLCLRQSIPRTRLAQQCRRIQSATNSTGGRESGNRHWRWRWDRFHQPPSRRGLVLAAAATLSPIAFVQISEEDNEGTEMTAEGRMLEASREEIEKKVGDDVHGLRRVKDSIIYFLDVYLWEPLCTGMRFLHLVVIFVPVIATVPVIWIGSRDKEKDSERAGTLWWYWFLVNSMERAGPAFIKVTPLLIPANRNTDLF